jgi:hypothetical protein
MVRAKRFILSKINPHPSRFRVAGPGLASETGFLPADGPRRNTQAPVQPRRRPGTKERLYRPLRSSVLYQGTASAVPQLVESRRALATWALFFHSPQKGPRVPHISLVFCEMWDTTALRPGLFPQLRLFPQPPSAPGLEAFPIKANDYSGI